MNEQEMIEEVIALIKDRDYEEAYLYLNNLRCGDFEK